MNEFRQIGHTLIDVLAEHLETVEQRSLFPDVEPSALYDSFKEPLPVEPNPLKKVIAELEEKLFPYVAQVNHPGYFGYITPSPTPVGILGDLITSALNQNVALYSVGPSAVTMERRTVRWLCDLVGYEKSAGGNLTSGGTMANFIGLKLARDYVTEDQAQREGVQGRMAAYTSEERHVSVDKAVDAVGIGRENLRLIPTDDSFRVRVDTLKRAIEEDRSQGIRPVCIIGHGGTTNTGAVDQLGHLREIANLEGLWLHVDAAYGGGMLLSRDQPYLLDGLQLANSVTLDPHKWFFAPLDVGAILVRDESRLTRSFGMRPAYLTDRLDQREERYDYFVHGFEQSRRFRALKVWMSFKKYGTRQLGRWVDANVGHARRLYELAETHPEFRAVHRPQMSAICLRYDPDGYSETELGQLHAIVARRVEESGRFWISTTTLKGKTYFRVNPVNFRTRIEDMEGLFRLLEKECAAACHSVSSTAPDSGQQ